MRLLMNIVQSNMVRLFQREPLVYRFENDLDLCVGLKAFLKSGLSIYGQTSAKSGPISGTLLILPFGAGLPSILTIERYFYVPTKIQISYFYFISCH